MQNNHTFFFAKTTAELFYQLTSVSALEVVGGCTSLERMPQKAISVHGISDLASITMHERYIDCGPAVTLSDILSLASARVPEALTESVKSIANPFVRRRNTADALRPASRPRCEARIKKLARLRLRAAP